MRAEIEFLIGCFGISVVFTYAWWTRVRIWVFRQDLFAIRDELWDQMEKKGKLDDLAYRDLRDAINSLIRLAPFLSLLTLIRLLLFHQGLKKLLRTDDSVPELRAARSKAVIRAARYILFESLSGLVLTAIATVFGIATALRDALVQRIEWLLDSRTIQNLDDNLSLSAGGRVA
jgi:hypothetical protein